MKLTLAAVALCASSVLADITSDKALVDSLVSRELTNDATFQIDTLVKAAKGTASDRGYDFVPSVDYDALKAAARALPNPQIIADLQMQQDFSYYIFPLECKPPIWYDVLSNFAVGRTATSFVWVLDMKPEPHTLADYNAAIEQAYRMYAAQQAASFKESSQGVTMIVNWPPPGAADCIPKALVTSTNIVPGPMSGTTTIKNPDGGYYVQITYAPVSTHDVPGTTSAFTYLTNENGDFYEQLTKVPVSTNIVPGPTAGSETLTNTDGDFYKQITKVPVSTNFVPGPLVGSTILTNDKGDLYEQVTTLPVPVSTNFVPGPVAGSTTLTNADGDLYEQVTTVPAPVTTSAAPAPVTTSATPVPISTNFVPGPVAGTETLTNSDGDLYEQVTTVPVPVTTNFVPGPVVGTETLTNSNGELYEQVTTLEVVSSEEATPSPSPSTEASSPAPASTEVSSSFSFSDSVSSSNSTNDSISFSSSSANADVAVDINIAVENAVTVVVAGVAPGTQTLTRDKTVYVEVTRVPVFTKTVIGLIAGSDFHVDDNGDFYELVTCVDDVITKTVGGTTPAKPTVTVTVLATADEAGNVSVDSAPARDTNEGDASEGTETVFVTIVRTATLDVPKAQATSAPKGSDSEVSVPGVATEHTESIAPAPAAPAGSAEPAGPIDSVISVPAPPAEAPAPAEVPAPADVPAPAEIPAPVDVSAPAEIPAPPADGAAPPNQAGVVEVIQSPQDTVETTPAQANDASKLAVGIAMALPLALVFL